MDGGNQKLLDREESNVAETLGRSKWEMCPPNECANQNPKAYQQKSMQKQRAKQNQQSRDKFIPSKMDIIKQSDFKIIMFTVLLRIKGEIASIFYKRGRHLKMKVACQLFLNKTGKIVKNGKQ